MKVLIWFLCIFANALITTLIKEAGVILGAIPTVILYGATFWLARTLCKKWDEHKELKTRQKMIAQDFCIQIDEFPESEEDKIQFCRKCGEKLIDSSKFCRKCGTEIVEEPSVAIEEPENIEFCKKCGADITNDTDTCQVCGEQKAID